MTLPALAIAIATLAIAYLALGVYIAVRHGDEADAMTEVRT